MPDHSTPEGRRCPECGGTLNARVPNPDQLAEWWCPECGRHFMDIEVLPTPAPVGGEARCKCGDPACTLWREDEVCPYCSAKSAALDADPEYEGRSGDGGEGHYGECAHGERSAPTLAATGGEEEDCVCSEDGLCALHGKMTGPSGMRERLLVLHRRLSALRRQLAEAEERAETNKRLWKEEIQERRADIERATTAERRLEEASRSWRCFFCDEVFTDKSAARRHFDPSGVGGARSNAQCLRDACDAQIRAVQQQLTASQQEVARLTEELRAKAVAHERTYQAWESEREEKDATIARLREALELATGIRWHAADCLWVYDDIGYDSPVVAVQRTEQARRAALSPPPKQGEEQRA